MRRILATAATLGLAGLGVIVPATSAQADPVCDSKWRSATSGFFYAYDTINCGGYLGREDGNDSHWGNSSGGFRSGDNNEAGSILHKGTSGMAVKVYDYVNYGGGYNCIKKSEVYVDDLARNKFTSGENVYNDITSHKWVWNSACNGHFMQ